MLDEDNPLTKRQQEVLQLARRGLRSQEIADALSISPTTVKVHLRSVFRQLGVTNRLQAVWVAEERGLFEKEACG